MSKKMSGSEYRKELVEIFELKEIFLSKFEFNVENIFLMIAELEKDYYEEYLNRIPLIINSPLEDAIRFKFLIIVELFKKFSSALCFNLFKFNKHYNASEKYYLMNIHIFDDKNIALAIQKLLEYRNTLAHVFNDDFTDFYDFEFNKIEDYCKILLKVFREYLDYIESCKKKITWID